MTEVPETKERPKKATEKRRKNTNTEFEKKPKQKTNKVSDAENGEAGGR